MPPKLGTLKRHTPGGAGVLRDGADEGIQGYSSAYLFCLVITLSRAIAACLRGFAKHLMNKQQETRQRISLLSLHCAFKQAEALIHSEKRQVMTFEGRRKHLENDRGVFYRYITGLVVKV